MIVVKVDILKLRFANDSGKKMRANHKGRWWERNPMESKLKHRIKAMSLPLSNKLQYFAQLSRHEFRGFVGLEASWVPIGPSPGPKKCRQPTRSPKMRANLTMFSQGKKEGMGTDIFHSAFHVLQCYYIWWLVVPGQVLPCRLSGCQCTATKQTKCGCCMSASLLF